MIGLYHYTCQHGRDAIGEAGTLLAPEQVQPGHAARLPPHMRELSWFIWLTDLDVPHRDALGLTSHSLACDRTRYRYRVADTSHARRWTQLRSSCHPGMVEALESAPGAMPAHWWIATHPVRVHYAPPGRHPMTHPICRDCFGAHFPGRVPVRVRCTEPEKCCVCGDPTTDGIYIRADPESVAYPRTEGGE
jgi:hypothetical protein